MSRPPGNARTVSIRARMIAGTVALLAAALAAFGVLTYSLLQRSLVGRIDEQLVSAHGPAMAELRAAEPSPGGIGSSTALLPVGTVAQLRGPDGAVRETRSFGVAEERKLRLPGGLAGGPGGAGALTAGLCTRWSVAFGLRPVTAMARAADRITAAT